MKTYTLGLILLLFMGCKTEIKKEPVPDVKKETVANSLYTELDGSPINLSDYKGKKILLNYWATWCVPCRKEMPAMLRAQDILEKENYVFLLASDESIEKIKKFKANTKYKFHFIKFTGALAQYKIYALPTTFIYNEKGDKVDRIVGAVEWDSKEIIDKLKNIQ